MSSGSSYAHKNTPKRLLPSAPDCRIFTIMKILACIFFLLSGPGLMAQNASDYNNLLKKTREIVITDSILVEVNSVEHIVLDTTTLKNYFQMFYPPMTTRRSFAMEYFISGKSLLIPIIICSWFQPGKKKRRRMCTQNRYTC